MLVFVTGCPFLTPDPCANNACDDGDACTVDTCTNDGGTAVCDNTAMVCDAGLVCVDGTCTDLCDGVVCEDTDGCTDDSCDTATGGCVFANNTAACDDADDCTENDACSGGVCAGTAMACDDGLFCNGTETCVAGACDPGTDPCDANEVCDEVSSACTTPCTSDAGCADAAWCNGDETCGADGICADGTGPCAAGITCDETNDICGDACTNDTQCDNGLWCDGAETCVASACTAGTDACDPVDETCDEANDKCDFVGTSRSFTLTTGTDSGASFVGTSGNDTYDGQLFLTGGGTFVLTLNNADVLDGGNGTDTLSAQFNPAAATTTTPTMPNIEVFNLEVTTGNPQTLSMGNSGSETTFNYRNSQTDGGDLMLTNVAKMPTNFGMTNCTENLTATMTVAALSGTTDACTLTFDGVTLTGGEPTIVLQPATAAKSGYETINIVSQGGVINSIQDLQQGNGNSLTTINVSGSADLDMNANGVDTTVTTFDASAATGDVDALVPGDGSAGTGITVKGGSGDDDLDCTDTADENFTVDGGAGDDKITFNGNYDSTSPFSDTIDGGAGTDTLVVATADATTTAVQSSVSNIETLQVSDALNGNLDALAYWGSGITKVTLAAGIDGTARTITLPNAGTLDMDADAGAATHVLQVSGTGTSDAVTLDLASGVDFPNPLTVTGIEILTIAGPTTAGTKNDFGNTVTMTASAGGSTKIVVTGANEVEFSGAVTAGIIDGSAATGTIDIQANMAAASSILGGSAADTLTGSDSNDVLSGGAGADTIDGQDGEDTLTGGAGADTFVFVTGDQSAAPSSSIYSTITDFESDSDIFDDTAALTIASGTTSFGVAVASISAEGFCTFNAADDTLTERIIAAEAGIAANGTAAAGQLALFEHGGHTYLFVSGGTDGITLIDLLFQLNGVTGLTNTTLTAGNLTIK